jgi:regulator of protease activity HflC (stomatin/prohibitin superfamily)
MAALHGPTLKPVPSGEKIFLGRTVDGRDVYGYTSKAPDVEPPGETSSFHWPSLPYVSIWWLCGALVVIYFGSGINFVTEWERRPILRFGRYVDTIGPGLVWYDPAFHVRLEAESIQDEVYEINIENVQTHDNVPISCNALVTARLPDADAVRKVTVAIDNGASALEQRALACITEAIGATELAQILHERQAMYGGAIKDLQARVLDWGFLVVALELKDIAIADDSIREAIAMRAKATKEAEAELVRAEMQHQIAKELSTAAAAYSPEAWHLKQLEVLVELTRSADNNTILIPTEVLKFFKPAGKGE